ncbi:MAG: polymer-forming cytoskeletal protein [Acidobacteriota bacterium]|nr:polymer-forming cytoskeletal protein [Acidobacteriota bacterium]MDE2964634.1 polymer-forming cytoskeletal protein [Acidobacteriota bacterium]
MRTANIGESLRFEGTLNGLEDVVVDGEVKGTIRLPQCSLTVGPSGRIDADIEARNLTVLGHITGNIVCLERMSLCSTGSVDGDVRAPRILIEDGAVVRGRIDVVKPQPASEAVPQAKAAIPSTKATRAPGP